MSSLTEQQRVDIQKIITEALDIAEGFWDESGQKLEKEAALSANVMDSISEARYSEESIVSQIPDHEVISTIKSENDEFIAIVADMRNSTKHAKTTIKIMSPLKRIFLETSALLPAIEKVINIQGGQVTEYLGDGVLGFFKFNKENIYKSYNAAKAIINEIGPMLNDILYERYLLPKEIYLGVGLAKSQAIIYAAGVEKRYAKAFGSCVYDATKLSSGTNIIGVSNELEAVWPKSEGGLLKFEKYEFKDLKGYKINPKK